MAELLRPNLAHSETDTTVLSNLVGAEYKTRP